MKLDFDYIYDVLKENVFREGDVWSLSRCICGDEIYLDLWKKCSNYDEFYNEPTVCQIHAHLRNAVIMMSFISV